MLRTRPPDPSHDQDAVAAARARLLLEDDRLDIWWCDKRRLWKGMAFMRKAGTWSFVFYWQGPNGEYRRPLPVEPIMEKLRSIDWERYVHSESMQENYDRELGAKRTEMLEAKKKEIEYMRKQYVQDVMKRGSDLLPGTGGAKRRMWDEARAEHRRGLDALLAEQGT